MGFAQGRLLVGESFGDESRFFQGRFAPMDAPAHPRLLFKPRSLGTILGTSTSFGSAWDGCRKNLPLCDLAFIRMEPDSCPRADSSYGFSS